MGNLTSPKFPEDEIPGGGVLHPDGLILGGLPKPVASLDLLMDPPDLGTAGTDIDKMAGGTVPRTTDTPDYTVGPVDMPGYHFYPDRLETDYALLGEPRVQALMATIRGREGPQYDVLHGGGRFNDYSRHPNILVNGSTAAGAYQFNYPTWNDQKRALGLADFTAPSQDLAAVDLLRHLHATDRLLSNDVDEAIFNAGQRWQSLPTTGEQTTDPKGRIRGINHPRGGEMTPTNTLGKILADYQKNLR